MHTEQTNVEALKPVKKTEANAVARREASPPAAAMTPMEMLSQAIERGASMDLLEKLMTLQERWEANEARKAFDEAVADAKADIKPIARNATGHNSKKYADFGAIAKEVDPILGRHGLSYRFRTQQGEKISVTCVLAHKAGHYEETTLSGPADASGSKNAIQAIGSTLTYLQRYTLVQMLGLAASSDDDGKAAGAPDDGSLITEDQLAELIALADDLGADKAKFCKFAKIESFADIRASKFEDAKAALRSRARAS